MNDREEFEKYLDEPCSELPANDHGRNDAHRLMFDDFGIPLDLIFYVWQAACATAPSDAIATFAEKQAAFEKWMLSRNVMQSDLGKDAGAAYVIAGTARAFNLFAAGMAAAIAPKEKT